MQVHGTSCVASTGAECAGWCPCKVMDIREGPRWLKRQLSLPLYIISICKKGKKDGKLKASHLLFSPWKAMEGASWFILLNGCGRTRWLGTAWPDQGWVMPDQPGCLLWWNVYICECRAGHKSSYLLKAAEVGYHRGLSWDLSSLISVSATWNRR